MKSNKLSCYIDQCQSRGKYWFTKTAYLQESLVSETAFNGASYRLEQKNRLTPIAKGFYVIIPLEYKASGILPANWYLDPFMQYLNKNYYVGLLTAASIHGASHQQPQHFQVISDAVITLGVKAKNKTNLEFVVNKNCASILKEKYKGQTGYFNISTKGSTVLDLVQYYHLCGYWNNVATVIAELSDDLDETLLVEAAIAGNYEITTLQRLGYILELVSGNGVDKLHNYLNSKRHKYVFLTPKSEKNYTSKNKKWKILINDSIEVDL